MVELEFHSCSEWHKIHQLTFKIDIEYAPRNLEESWIALCKYVFQACGYGYIEKDLLHPFPVWKLLVLPLCFNK